MILIAEPSLSDNATVTASSELTNLPATNLQIMQPSKVWRTGASSAYLTIDLGKVEGWNFVGLFNTNATAITKWRIRADNNSGNLSGDGCSYDSQYNYHWPVTDLDGYDSQYNNTFIYIPTEQQLQYIRIDVDVNTGYYQAGRLYVAKAWIPSNDVLINDGFTLGMTDSTILTQSFGGQVYPNVLTAKRNYSLTLNLLAQDEMLSNYWYMSRLRQLGADVVLVRWKSIPYVRVIRNPGFEVWNGVTSAPSGWTLSGAGATVSRNNTIKKFGRYSAAITRNGANASLYQDVEGARGVAYWQGKTIAVGVWAYTSVANTTQLYLSDGMGSIGTSSYHTGGGGWEWLTATGAVDGAASYVRLQNRVINSDATAYFDGLRIAEAGTVSSPIAQDELTHINTIYGLIKENTQINIQSYKYLSSRISVEELI